MSDPKITVIESFKGRNEKFFAVGGKDNTHLSSPVSKITLTICGKETFTVVDALPLTYPKTESYSSYAVTSGIYKEWFKFEAGNDSDAKCGDPIIYRLVDKDCSKDSSCKTFSGDFFKYEN